MKHHLLTILFLGAAITHAFYDCAHAASRKSKKYLLSFHTCETSGNDCSDPSNHQVQLAESDDGASWTLVSKFSSYAGSVPDAVHRKLTIKNKTYDKIYIYTPNTLTRFNPKSAKQEQSVPVTIDGLDGGGGYVDPSAFVDRGHLIWLTFLYCRSAGLPTMCFPESSDKTRYIGLAKEVRKSDGKRFKYVQDLLNLTTEGVTQGTDPDIFTDGKNYFLYVSLGSSFQAWSSSTLTGTYTKVLAPSNETFSNNTGSVPSGIYVKSDQRFWSYVHRSQSGVNTILRAIHPNFSTALASSDYSSVVTGQGLGFSATTSVESPGISKY